MHEQRRSQDLESLLAEVDPIVAILLNVEVSLTNHQL